MAATAIASVLVLGTDDMREAAARPLWVALDEVAKLFTVDADRATFRRVYVGNEVPSELGRPPGDDRLVLLAPDEIDALWHDAQGEYIGTVDQEALAASVVESTGLADEDAERIVVVTDAELTPPPAWRYILWDLTAWSWVVSVAPMDPSYWGIQAEDRVGIIKHRARAACMAVVGMGLGFARCDNEQCYLFGNVDSVTRLDPMVTIGPEHTEFHADRLLGYPARLEDPSAQQEIVAADESGTADWGLLS